MRVTFVADSYYAMEREVLVFLFHMLTLKGERAGFVVFDNCCCEVSKAEVTL